MLKNIMCLAGGVAIGYYIAHVRLEKDFQERLDHETQEVKYHYREFYRKKFEEQDTVQTAEDLRQKYAGVSVGTDILTQEMTAAEELPEPEERFVGDYTVTDIGMMERRLAEEKDAWDRSQEEHEAEKKSAAVQQGIESNRLTDELIAAGKPPKVNYNRISTPSKVEEPKAPAAAEPDEPETDVDFITKEAFFAGEFGYEQFSFTYFAGDDVLANEEDTPVTGEARAAGIGTETLRKLKVGQKAMDGEDVIYVRNHTGKWEFEVIRSDGRYLDEVGAGSE